MSSAAPTKAVSNRQVHHEVILHLPASLWSSERYDLLFSGIREDWSWRALVEEAERRWYPIGRVSVFRGKGRNRRKIYETKSS